MKRMTPYSLMFVLLLLVASCQNAAQKKDTAEKDTTVTVTKEKVYKAEWEDLKKHENPDWFLDSKFGIYCHWGPYSVPAFENEWYSKWMYEEGHKINKHHIGKYGTLDKFGYKDFIPMFTAEKFDANEWADLFVAAGAKFGGPVSEHADGFAMWDSKLTKWDAMDMGPKRDIVGEMAVALRERDLKFIATYHRQWLYAWYPTCDKNTDAGNPEFEGLYGPNVPRSTFTMAKELPVPMPDAKFNKEWYDRLTELIDKYEPDLIWFDNKMDIIDEQVRKDFLAYYYNAGEKQKREIVCTYKFTDLAKGTAILDVERSRMSEAKEFPWLTDDSIDWNAWCDISNPRYKSTNRLIDTFIDIISKNGCLLLNITPRADGSIPEPVKERLLEMGAWLKTNSEAVYGTRRWKIYGEGPTKVVEGHLSENKNKPNTAEDVRFTVKGDTLYAFLLDWPTEKTVIRALATGSANYTDEIANVELIGSTEKIDWKRTEAGLELNLPAELKKGEHAYAFKITKK